METIFEVLTDTIIHISEVQENLQVMIHDLCNRGIIHDRSKFQDPEFSTFVNTRPEFKKANYGTPEYEAVVKKAQIAVDHHYKNNRHHTNFHPNGITDMNLLDLLEMLADWRAAARRSPDLTFAESLPRAFKKYQVSKPVQQLFLNTIEYLGW
jgi:hypothetical protein